MTTEWLWSENRVMTEWPSSSKLLSNTQTLKHSNASVCIQLHLLNPSAMNWLRLFIWILRICGLKSLCKNITFWGTGKYLERENVWNTDDADWAPAWPDWQGWGGVCSDLFTDAFVNFFSSFCKIYIRSFFVIAQSPRTKNNGFLNLRTLAQGSMYIF